MTSSAFPDLNVWLALSYLEHKHHVVAAAWLSSLRSDARLIFCRHTQLGFFRLLTTEAIMGANVRTQLECWALFDQWIRSGKASLAPDPDDVDANFRMRAYSHSGSPKVWADAYLAAFAETSGHTLVTFDKALASQTQGALLLD